MATAEVEAALMYENEQITTEELSRGTAATGVTSAATEAKEFVQVEDDEEEEEWNVAPEETGLEDSGVGKDEEEEGAGAGAGAGTWDDEADNDKENREGGQK